MTKYIDITPTWEGLLQPLLAVMEAGTPEGHSMALKELYRMAQAADRLNRMAPSIKAMEDRLHAMQGVCSELGSLNPFLADEFQKNKAVLDQFDAAKESHPKVAEGS